MPSFVVHGLIPPLVMLATRGFDSRKVLWLLPVTFLPDVDILVGLGVHRATLGNAFIPLLVGLAAWWSAKIPKWSHLREWLAIAAIYLGSHAFMDLFAGGVVLFWPLWDRTFLIDVLILFDTATMQPIYQFQPATHRGAPVISPIYRFLDGPEFAMLAFVTIYLAAGGAWRRLRRRPGARIGQIPDARRP